MARGPQGALLIGRERETARCAAMLRSRVPAVLLLGETGVGKSALVAAVREELSDYAETFEIHGSPSLQRVPYGVLAPFLGGLPTQQAGSRIAVLRAFWRRVEELRNESEGSLILVIDDAHSIDALSAEVIAELVGAGWAQALVTSPDGALLPPPLMQLWIDGGAERLDLEPFTEAEATSFLEATLGSRVLPSTARRLWRDSQGNPLLLRCLMDEARRAGALIEQRGTWVLASELERRGDGLVGLVRDQLQRLSSEEREALMLVAVAQPAALGLVEGQFGADVVRSLVAKRLVQPPTGADGSLRLRHVVYGDAIYQLIPLSRSLWLQQLATEHRARQLATADGLLCAVSWALGCGLQLDDTTYLRAAQLAARLGENSLALRAVDEVRSPEHAADARLVRGLVAYSRNHHADAVELLEPTRELDAEGVLASGLLWLYSRDTLGHPHDEIARDIRRLAAEGGGGPWDLLRLVYLSLTGDYAGLEVGLAAWRGAEATERSAVERGVAAALEAEVLACRGLLLESMTDAARAIELLAPTEFTGCLSEFAALRYVYAGVTAGQWDAVESIPVRFAAPPLEEASFQFTATLQCARGLALLRQGRFGPALAILEPTLEELRVSDAQHVFRLCAAAAAYCAAKLGDWGQAADFLEDSRNRGRVSASIVRPIAELFEAAATCAIEPDEHSMAVFETIIDAATRGARRDVCLQALFLWFEAGQRDRLDELLGVAWPMEGEWAEAAVLLGAAFAEGSADSLRSAADALRSALYPRLARECYAEAFALLENTPARNEARAVWEGQRACEAELGETEVQPQPSASAGELTRRERQIVALAISGLSDRDIADRLTVSVRTVEGHLYRAYSKLGVSSREQLSSAVGLAPENEYTAPRSK
ncbi:LuxR C-terminal-related transcriptional regulator [Sinomonas sp. ASV322]|uniref:LuxR C-terminal-related transcriptional regulator n=1 Tax=Sinomonas sp. ASV322 TaxID=3041920 RepID=UPI0027DD1709|nr:LuxR C-terminal-related transcriptional regulator [Sinomonas sp. ASV322]MDQ4504326.1 LuxR C-terminal-related transcriptional regulator [Sinomonas sp. ASV322]